MLAGGNRAVDWDRGIDPVLAFWASASYEF